MATANPTITSVIAVGTATTNRIIEAAIRAAAELAWMINHAAFHPENAITWAGFFQFIGPASRLNHPLISSAFLGHFIRPVSSLLATLLGAFSLPAGINTGDSDPMRTG